MRQQGIAPTKVRFILSCILAAIVALQFIAIYFSLSTLHKTAPEVSKALGEREQNASTLDNLRQTEQRLEKQEDIINKTEKIVAESTQYKYQDQVINDITRYAKDSNIQVRSFSFQESSNSSPLTSSNKQTTAKPVTPQGVTQASVSVEFDGEVNYRNFLRFIRHIEKNLTKMQIKDLQLSSPEGKGNTINIPSVTIEVYIRK